MKCYVKFLLMIFSLFSMLCMGCVSLMEKAGTALDGSAFAEKRVAVYRTANSKAASVTTDMEVQELQNKAGEHSVAIALKKFPTMRIRGSAPNEEGEFYLTSLDYLGGSTHGWNEYRLDLSGYGKLVLGETTATLSIPDEIEPVQISSGRIRRYDTRITGTEALTNLRHRRERILALTEWMNGPESVGNGEAQKDCDAFEEYWKPLLFPEMVAKKKRPTGWQQEGDQWVTAEDIRWNSGYTGRTFPEELKTIRDSGTMLRDWEEAIEWIYIEYEWSRITELLAQETVLTKAKK